MPWLIWAVPLAVLLALAAVVAVRTWRFRPPAEEAVSPAEIPYDAQKAIDDLQRMVRCATISRYDPAHEDDTAFARFRALLPELFPRVHQSLSFEQVGRRGLLYRWRGRSQDRPVVLMAHYDVVPVEESHWTQPPFAGVTADGCLWGRGALDTKPTVNGILQAAETLLGRGFVPQQDIYLAFGGNEEIMGQDAPDMIAWFSARNIRPALVVDEGGAVVEHVFPGVRQPCAVIGTGEKGVMQLTMTAKTNGGHASAPPRVSSIGRLSRACLRVETHPLKRRLTAPVAGLFDTLGRHSSSLYRVIFANLWLFAGLLDLICKQKGGELNALMRTTVAWTQASGSSQTNVMPALAKMGANLRLVPGDSCADVLARLEKIVRDPQLQLEASGCQEPSPLSVTGNHDGWLKVRQAVRAIWPEALVSPYLMIACSDSRHYSRICDQVYRFSAMALTDELRKTIHGNDERIPLDAIGKAVAFYLELMLRC